MKNPIVPILVAGLVASCTGDAPTSLEPPGPEPLAPDLAVAAGCYAVSGALDQVVTNPAGELAGTISGDVEGTVVTLGGPVLVRGVVVTRPGEQTLEITGGIVEPLIGATLRLHVDVLFTTVKAPVLKVNTTARVIEGAREANLTYHGTTDASTGLSHLDYHGVICP
jgi:hypothetical protein